MVAYGYDAFLKYVAVRSGDIAQGERQITKETTTVSSPAYWVSRKQSHLLSANV